MNVRLIATTAPRLEEVETAEELIVYCARVSNPSNQTNMDTAPKLLRYCLKHGHWSIFEQASMTVEITTSRAIAQQILRHRSFSHQEFSQRYAAALDTEPVELRLQGKTNRQGGEELFQGPEAVRANAAVRTATETAFRVYQTLLDAGIAKECARFVLPLCTQTRLYMTGSVRSWIHYLQVRCDEHTQKEHRLIAEKIREIFSAEFPNIAEALKEQESA